ncbi:histidine phosphatase family protein [Thalassolituus alkanivorans]|uniref:histidine phosphatase family protein n=1 Tax=Thalassolituus alkanivorans TaxID=2881055 RepID=UPI001E2B2291|nr:histidine phosphatase family protein [Thalassolituus alkanivorans]MCB2386482.1 histidine phosphatase family protein [Thalassolituus alkanivorans]MCB2422965.1 histidine phosphatase family protein [Thalassolituus alkanivorans]
MAGIYLVRHGQAGFGKLNYDQLSDTGHLQGELVGKSLALRGIEAGMVVHGAMQRHRETMQGAQKHWHTFGPVSEMAGFNEFDSDDVIACAYPQFKNKAVLGAWILAQPNKRKAFQELFANAVERWTSGNHDSDYLESWAAFTGRVTAALEELLIRAEGKHVVVFTSGGPITAIAQQCLGLTHDKAFDMNWTLLNGGITQLLYNSKGKVSLASFNEQQHLAQAGKHFLTYR